jgi:putative two-component system response regulator
MKKIKVLIVDDEPANIQVLHAALKDMGRVQFAMNGQKALDICNDVAPDIIFLDLVSFEAVKRKF